MPSSDQKISSDRYTIIPRTLIFLICGKNVLLLKGAHNKRLWAGLYNGVGGHIERGEDILSAAQRVLQEETGLDVPNLWLCGTVIIDTGDKPGIGLYVLRGEYLEHSEFGRVRCQAGVTFEAPDGTLEWVPIAKINDLPLVGDLPTLLPHIIQAHISDPPFSALYTYNDKDQLEITFG